MSQPSYPSFANAVPVGHDQGLMHPIPRLAIAGVSVSIILVVAQLHAKDHTSRMPTEVMSMIFAMAAEPDSNDNYRPSYHPSSEDWRVAETLSGVSRRWNAIALGTPEVWTRIVVDVDRLVMKANGKMGLHPRPMKRHLERSRTRMVDVLVDARDPNWDGKEQQCVSFLLFYT
jgi:hypothetical protein